MIRWLSLPNRGCLLGLEKYEPRLASIWRYWQQASRLVRIMRFSQPKNLWKLANLAQMYGQNRKFWATNDSKYLDKALRIYFNLRSTWISDTEEFTSTSVVISGWALSQEHSQLKTLLRRFEFKRVFRPDVWYLTRKRTGLFSGFRLRAPIGEVAQVVNLIKETMPNVSFQLPLRDPGQQGSLQSARLEDCSPDPREQGLNWFSAFSISPRGFAWLVEASADTRMAKQAATLLSSLEDFNLGEDIFFCHAKFKLVSGDSSCGDSLGDFKLYEIKTPEWLGLKGSDLSPSELRPSIRPKYFEAQDLVVTNGGIITENLAFIDWDKAQNPALDFVAGNHPYVIGSSVDLERCWVRQGVDGAELQSAIVLSSRVDSNWFHFLIETLPRILLINEMVPSSVPVLVSTRVPKSGVEALQLLTSRNIIKVDETKNTKVRHAYVPGPVVYHPDTQFLWGSDPSGSINVDVLLRMRSIILDSISPKPAMSKTYLARSGKHRVIQNQKVVGVILTRLGFVTHDTAIMGFKQQVELVHSSKTLVAAGGAVMSNFIFARAGAKILVLVSKLGEAYLMPKHLGSLAQANVNILGGRRGYPAFLDTMVARSHMSFKVKLFRLIRAVLLSDK